MDMWFCVCVRTGVISHWIKHSKCFSWDIFALTCKWAAQFVILCWQEKHVVTPLFLKRLPWLWSDVFFFYLSLPSSHLLPLPLSVFVILYQTALSRFEHTALKIFRVALRRSRLLLHANVLCPAPEDKNKSSVWNLSQFAADSSGQECSSVCVREFKLPLFSTENVAFNLKTVPHNL